MLVVSDLHLGNPLYRPRRPFVDFMRFAREREYAVCINGDGVDIVQSSITRLARDLGGCHREFARFAKAGLPIYYTVGNHDIALEQFLDDWGVVRVVPFLNVLSGDQRIRLEHGHIYDDMFVKYPRTYNVATWLGTMTLRLSSRVFCESPAVFRAFERVNDVLTALGEWHQASAKHVDAASRLAREIPGERAPFIRAALEIASRGFDAVIFGHTHHAGQVTLPNGSTYYNTGLWHTDPHFAEVDHGRVTLQPVSAIAD
jgi:UDP-2,3-diacylglucosamine pyrophosphatase LpxH